MNQRRPLHSDIPPSPHGLWSLWDMLLAYGYLFSNLMGQIADIQALAERDPTGTAKKNIYTGSLRGNVCEEAIQTARILAKETKMKSVTNQVGRLRSMIEMLQSPLSKLAPEFRQLWIRIEEELVEKNFLFVADADLYNKKDPFCLGDNFEEAQENIASAARCLAIKEPTASVFHLMRALEFAVRKIARRRNFQIKITPQTTWRQITGCMDDKIKKMPEKTHRQKEQKQEWESARANLHHVGSVWRNKTMHPAKNYTDGQAEDIFNATRVLMNDLCAL